jgi:hypothetical protein
MPRKERSPELDKLAIILPHLIHHNNEHARGMKKWIDVAQHAGAKGSAAALSRARSHLEKAGKEFGAALRKLQPAK